MQQVLILYYIIALSALQETQKEDIYSLFTYILEAMYSENLV